MGQHGDLKYHVKTFWNCLFFVSSSLYFFQFHDDTASTFQNKPLFHFRNRSFIIQIQAKSSKCMSKDGFHLVHGKILPNAVSEVVSYAKCLSTISNQGAYSTIKITYKKTHVEKWTRLTFFHVLNFGTFYALNKSIIHLIVSGLCWMASSNQAKKNVYTSNYN